MVTRSRNSMDTTRLMDVSRSRIPVSRSHQVLELRETGTGNASQASGVAAPRRRRYERRKMPPRASARSLGPWRTRGLAASSWPATWALALMPRGLDARALHCCSAIYSDVQVNVGTGHRRSRPTWPVSIGFRHAPAVACVRRVRKRRWTPSRSIDFRDQGATLFHRQAWPLSERLPAYDVQFAVALQTRKPRVRRETELP